MDMGHGDMDMDHGGMDKGHGSMNMGHGGMDMSSMMLLNWKTTDFYILFPSWHITSIPAFVVSLFAVIIITTLYEALKNANRGVESRSRSNRARSPNTYEHAQERDSLLWSGPEEGPPKKKRSVVGGLISRSHVTRAALYTLQAVYSLFIMLLFMTLNGYVMLAVAVGKFLGYCVFGSPGVMSSGGCD